MAHINTPIYCISVKVQCPNGSASIHESNSDAFSFNYFAREHAFISSNDSLVWLTQNTMEDAAKRCAKRTIVVFTQLPHPLRVHNCEWQNLKTTNQVNTFAQCARWHASCAELSQICDNARSKKIISDLHQNATHMQVWLACLIQLNKLRWENMG